MQMSLNWSATYDEKYFGQRKRSKFFLGEKREEDQDFKCFPFKQHPLYGWLPSPVINDKMLITHNLPSSGYEPNLSI